MTMYSIGREPDNDIQINHPAISAKNQLKAEVKSDGQVLVYHHGKNDTYVNGNAIKKCPLRPEDNIRIGNFKMPGSELIQLILQRSYKDRTNFSKEFGTLVLLLEVYEKRKAKIEKPSIVPKLAKIGLSGTAIALLLIYPEILPNESWRYPLIFGAGILGTVFSGVGNNKKKKKNKLTDLVLEYEDDLKCPKCQTSLLNMNSYMLRKKGACLNKNCSATFDLNSHTEK